VPFGANLMPRTFWCSTKGLIGKSTFSEQSSRPCTVLQVCFRYSHAAFSSIAQDVLTKLADFETVGTRWVKIADFGISKRLDGTALRTFSGTEGYLAPEVQGYEPDDFSEEDERTFSLAVDIWSVGAITFRMIVGNLPFPSKRNLRDYAMRGQPFPMEESLGLQGARFVMETMAASPRLRLTSEQALSHQWIISQGSTLQSLGQPQSQRYKSFVGTCGSAPCTPRRFTNLQLVMPQNPIDRI
jgi:serine/threonine protein kinase